MPIKIVFDTNSLFDRWFLDKPQFDLLRRHSASGRSTIIIPSVVVLKLQNNYFKRVSEHVSAAQKLNQMLPKGYAPLSFPSSATLVDEYLVLLRGRMEELRFKEIGFADIPHERIMEKAVKRKKPFQKGGKGYQDCVIWETILRKVANRRYVTYFVTNNHEDFAANDKKSLHPDLLEDMQQHRIPKNRIQLIPDLKTLIDSVITPEMSAVENDEKLSALRSLLRDWISKNADKIMRELNRGEINLDSVVREAETVVVDNLEDPESFEIDSVSALDEETEVVIGTATIDASLSFFLSKSEYMMLDPPHPFSVADNDWNDHYIWAEMEVRLTLRFVFSVSIETNEVLDFEVENVTEFWGYCRHCGAIEYNDAAEVCSVCKRRYF